MNSITPPELADLNDIETAQTSSSDNGSVNDSNVNDSSVHHRNVDDRNADDVNGGDNVADGYGSDRQWLAQIDIHAVKKSDRTRLKHLKHVGPLRVQRPFYPEGDCCHVYLLHPPGGMVSGDQLAINIDVSAGAHTLVTTPSAGKLYRGDSCSVPQSQVVNITVDNGICEWLPQETILFDGALGSTALNVELKKDAQFIGWELFCLGRPASNLPFNEGWFRQQLNIQQEGELILFEKQDLKANSDTANQRWGFNGLPVSGTFIACGFQNVSEDEMKTLIKGLRETVQPPEGSYLSLTWRMGVLIGRYLGHNTEQARACFTQLWQGVRPVLLDREATIPRIWMT